MEFVKPDSSQEEQETSKGKFQSAVDKVIEGEAVDKVIEGEAVEKVIEGETVEVVEKVNESETVEESHEGSNGNPPSHEETQ